MKLWLQVLFAQGYLWRDRFPAQFGETSTQKPKLLGTVVWGFLVPSLALLAGWVELADGNLLSGLPAVALSVFWVLWSVSGRWVERLVGGKALWLSIHWATGFLAVISIVATLILPPLENTWGLMPLALVLLLCSGTAYLRALQSNYLIFVSPEENAWRLTPPAPAKAGFVAAWREWLLETYWRLPRKTLFGEDDSPPPASDGMA